jgi:hypothetical protein
VGCGRVTGRDAARVPGRRVAGADRGQPGRDPAWAVHVDHVVTAAETQVVNRSIEAALAGEPQAAQFHVLVRREQRKLLRAVPRPDPGGAG